MVREGKVKDCGNVRGRARVRAGCRQGEADGARMAEREEAELLTVGDWGGRGQG